MTISQGIKTVFRDTVLITDDRLTIFIIFIVIIIAYGIRSTIFLKTICCYRNLKLKAHTSDCAVNTIKEFMSWVSMLANIESLQKNIITDTARNMVF